MLKFDVVKEDLQDKQCLSENELDNLIILSLDDVGMFLNDLKGTWQMEAKISKLLEEYEDKIMLYTLGSSVNEYNKRYVDVYYEEWYKHRESIARSINKLIEYDNEIVTPTGFAYIIINEWLGVMTLRESSIPKRSLNIQELAKVCESILVDIKSWLY